MKRRIYFLIVCFAVCISCKQSQSYQMSTSKGGLIFTPLSDNSIRVSLQTPGASALEELYYTEKTQRPSFTIRENDSIVRIVQKELLTLIDKKSGRIDYFDQSGKPLVSDLSRDRGRVCFLNSQDERLYGLGQFQDGYLNVKGLSRRLTQVNTQIAIPFIMSNKSYAVMWNNYGLTEFNPCVDSLILEKIAEGGDVIVNTTGTSGNRQERRYFESFKAELSVAESGEYALLLDIGQSMARKHYLSVDGRVLIDCNNLWLPPSTSVICYLEAGNHSIEVRGVRGDAPKVYWRAVDSTSTFFSPNGGRMDYTIFAGDADRIVDTYRSLTGEAPLMPSWALGYIHCRERYNTQEELLQNARRFKEEGIPVDVIVQDWQWWGKYGWNAMRFDEEKYPDPKAMVDSLHQMDMKLMISVWSKVDRNSVLGKSLAEKAYYIEDTEWIDYFKDEAAEYYWQNFRDSLVRHGIDAWWFDATEPENDDLARRYEQYRNVYPLKVLKTVYEGFKSIQKDKEPVILTRSMAPGIQRYGAVCWSGDVGNDWETLRRQIVGGLGLMSCGLPWWTYDAGGFFRPADQYTNSDYHERMLRWIQCSVWLPLMRVHGYMSRTEPWNYPDEVKRLFVKAIEQRQALKPYLEECARMVAEQAYTIMRPLYFDFPSDSVACDISDQYMFGPNFLVCPVLEAEIDSMQVYLPCTKGGWTDIRNGKHYESGFIEVSVDLEAIPVFERTQF